MDHFAEAGVRPRTPTTSWWKWGQQLVKARGAGTAIAIAGNQAWDLLHNWAILLWAWGGDLVSSDFKKATFIGPEGIEAMTWYVDLVRNGLASKACAEYTQPDCDAAFINGNVSMAFMGPWNIADILHDNPSLNYAVVEPPMGPTGRRAAFSGGSNLAILAASRAKDEAKQWIKFLIDKENLVSYTSGLTNMLPSLVEAFEDRPRHAAVRAVQGRLEHATAYPPLACGAPSRTTSPSSSRPSSQTTSPAARPDGIKKHLDTPPSASTQHCLWKGKRNHTTDWRRTRMPHYTSHHRTGSGCSGMPRRRKGRDHARWVLDQLHAPEQLTAAGRSQRLNAVDARWATTSRCGQAVRDGGDVDTAFARMLHTVDVGGLPGVQRIEYTGRYPFAHLVYVEPGLPVEVQLDAFSPIIPGDAESSSVPVAVFLFKVKNTCQAGWVDAAIMAMARNTVSAWNVGRFNEAVSSGEARGVLFSSDSPLPTDPAAGTVCLATCAGAGEVTVCTSWNLKTADPFNLTLANQNIEPWQEFARDGRITPRDCGTVQGEGVELAGALAVRFELAPGETKHVPVVLAWHMPQTHFGHVYEARYADAAEVAADVLRSWEELRTRALKWSEALEVAKGEAAERGRVGDALPDWLADALLNNFTCCRPGRV